MPTARHFLSLLTIADNISFDNKRRLKCEGFAFSDGSPKDRYQLDGEVAPINEIQGRWRKIILGVISPKVT